MLMPRFVVSIYLVGVIALGAGMVSGQDFPNKPIRIATAGAGGGSDFISRQIAQGISGPLGQPVIVMNTGGGGGGVIQGEFLLKSPPDGSGLAVVGGSFWITPLLQKMPYDVVRDFSPISLVAREVSVVAVHPSVPAKSVKELIVLAKASPGALNYGSSSTGSPSHLAGELFNSLAGVRMVRVAYKGSALAITALISGEVPLVITDAGLVMPHVKSGRLRALAVTSAQPTALVPGMPTVAASGLPGYEIVGMTTIFAPGRTPMAIINRLNQEIVRVLSMPDVKERLLSTGVEAVGTSPEQFAAILKADIATMGKLIKDAGIKVN